MKTKTNDSSSQQSGLEIRLFFWRRITRLFAREYLEELYLALFGRGVEPESAAALLAKSRRSGNPAGVLNVLLHSEEFQRNGFKLLAPGIARECYRGILGREGDPKGLEGYTRRLAREGKLDAILTLFVKSAEFQRRSFSSIAPYLARAFYRGILGRDANLNGVEECVRKLNQKENVEGVLGELLASDEFRQRSSGASRPMPQPHPSRTYDEPCWIFLHGAKTAGTSIQSLLIRSFPAETIFHEHNDTLYLRSPGELSKYSVFAGHFEYDSLAYIPKKTKNLLTFFREPTDRLCSLYYFRRAVEPGHHMFGFESQAANELDMENFYKHGRMKGSVSAWNHMAFTIMGSRQWTEWKQRILERTEAGSVEDFIDTVARPAIRQRLRQFSFIGLKEDFDNSVKMLFKTLGKPEPKAIPEENTLDGLMKSAPHFKKRMEKQPITPSCMRVLESLVQLDKVVYQEAKTLYAEQIARYKQSIQGDRQEAQGHGAGVRPNPLPVHPLKA